MILISCIQPLHLDYIIAASNLHAFNYGLRGTHDQDFYRKVADSVLVPEFTPKSGITVQINDSDPTPANEAAGDGTFCRLALIYITD